MGLNIIAYVLGERVETDHGDWYIETIPFTKFDSMRFSYDREFATCREFAWDFEQDDPNHPYAEIHGRTYYRPHNLNEAREWIKKNVVESNQQRLLTLLDDMEIEPDLYLYFAW